MTMNLIRLRLLAAVLAVGPVVCPTASMAQVGLLQTQAGDLPMTVVYPTAAAATTQSFGPFKVSVGQCHWLRSSRLPAWRLFAYRSALCRPGGDQILNPTYHAGHVLANCKTCEELDMLTDAGHFDVLWPSPESIAQATARMPGGARNNAIDDPRRQRADSAVTAFFSKTLLP